MYLMSYFRTEAEALHLALSADGILWEPLNGNRPVLEGTAGSRTLRDPHLSRDREGRYHLLATDGWASDGIVHCSSDDLLTWSAREAVPVMASVEGARNCWAPEVFRDEEHGVYRLIWSSTVQADDAPARWDHRIWTCTTEDFVRYGPPEPYLDPGYSVIDATVAHDVGRYLLAFKDERGENRLGTPYKAIRVCLSGSATGPWVEISDLVTPSPVEGPTLLRRADGWLMLYDYFLEERYGASASADGLAWRVVEEEVLFPPGARHASALPLDGVTARRLRSRYG